MKIINFHNHIYPEKIAVKATDSIEQFYHTDLYQPKMFRPGSVAEMLKAGEEAGISKHLVHSVATTAAQVPSINNFIAGQCAEHDNFIGFGALHPDVEDVPAEIERMISLGLKGVKLHPDFQKFNIDDKCVFPIYEACEGKLPILIHTGDYRYTYSHPKRVVNVLEQFPSLTIICAHFGGWSVWDEAIPCMKQCNCYMDTSSTFGFVGKEKMKELILTYGPDKLLFGTDFPMWSSKDEIENIMSMGLSEDWLEKIFYKNAEELLNLHDQD